MGTKVYMTHPEHGAMHVYSQWQIEDNIKHGWKLDIEPWLKDGGIAVPAGIALPAGPQSVSVDIPANEVTGLRPDLTITPPPPRRGRPPKS